MTTNLNESVYIPSIEASDIYLHNHYNQPIYIKYVGMIPKSLELESLIKHGMNIFPNGKRRSNDVINISFKTSVKPVVNVIDKKKSRLRDVKKQLEKYSAMLDRNHGKKEIERINKKIESRTKSIEKIKSEIKLLESTKWDTLGTDDLRYEIYSEDGFFITHKDKDGKVIEKVDYMVSSRSSAKSRIGKVLAIRKELHEDMKLWRRMGLTLDGRDDVDFVSVLAYESLMGSSIIDTVKISPKNILIIEDYVDKFDKLANLVTVDSSTDLLISHEGMGKFENTIWDGQALLTPEYFADTDKSMKLLRQHWFKAAAFKTDIQRFMRERAVEYGIDYDTWELKDAYNNRILAKDVHMITTPSSLKFQKIAHVVGTKADMYRHWIKQVEAEGNLFGVVKTEKSTKLGYTKEGQPIQQMSYQYLNSLPISEDKLKELAEYELDFIDGLKNDESVFIEYIMSKADITNGNNMMADLYKRNPDIVGTEMWRRFKKDTIKDYIECVRFGKMKIPNADYMVLVSNPIEQLYASVGRFNGQEMALSGQQVYCKRFNWEKPLIGMRSPHTSSSNVLYSISADNQMINDYMPDLSKNIVVINNIGATVFERLSGADADSDAMWMSDNYILAEVAGKCNKEYLVCKPDNIGTKPNKYNVCYEDMAKIDNELKNDYIGVVTNIAALLCSHIWDSKAKGRDTDKMMEKLYVLSIMQGLVIDYAKRIPAISIEKQVTSANNLLSELLGNEKHIPKWWTVRNKDVIKQHRKKMKKNEEMVDDYSFDCPMDYLYRLLDKIPNAPRQANVDIQTLIRKLSAGKANNKQKHIISELLDDANDKLKATHVKKVDDETKKELHVERLDTINFAVELMSKIKMNEHTMYAIIQTIVKNTVDNSTIRSFNLLYNAKKTLFLNAFVKK